MKGGSEMTVKEKAISILTERGMFTEDAGAVLERAIPEFKEKGLSMSSPIEGYPNAVFDIMTIILKRHALTWIDEKYPQAWYREMFVPNSEADIRQEARKAIEKLKY